MENRKKDFRFYPRKRMTKFLGDIKVKVTAKVVDEKTIEVEVEDPKKKNNKINKTLSDK